MRLFLRVSALRTQGCGKSERPGNTKDHELNLSMVTCTSRPRLRLWGTNPKPLQTWEGEKVIWSLIVQQKMHVEILCTKRGIPQVVKLYSIFTFQFYIKKCLHPL